MLSSVTPVLLGRSDSRGYPNQSRHRTVVLWEQDSPDSRDWGGQIVIAAIRQLWNEDRGQDVAEYAVMLAVILVIVIGTVRLIGGNANNVFSTVSSSLSN